MSGRMGRGVIGDAGSARAVGSIPMADMVVRRFESGTRHSPWPGRPILAFASITSFHQDVRVSCNPAGMLYRLFFDGACMVGDASGCPDEVA